MSNTNELKLKTVAFYDSGIGGLTLLKRAVSEINNANFIYLGDNINAPYGNKSKQQLTLLSKKNIEYLVRLGADVITLACNTLTTTLLSELKNDELVKEYNVKLTGITPTVPNPNKKTVLLCTPQTAKSQFVKENYADSLVIRLPFLAGEIDRFIFDKSKINYNRDFDRIPNDVEEIVLGCTHYAYLQSELNKAFPNASIVSGETVAVNDVKTALNDCYYGNFNKNKVTYDHLLKFAPKIALGDKRWIKFVKKSAKYNKSVYEILLK